MSVRDQLRAASTLAIARGGGWMRCEHPLDAEFVILPIDTMRGILEVIDKAQDVKGVAADDAETELEQLEAAVDRLSGILALP